MKFIKHIKLKKDITIKKLISNVMSQSTAYRLFKKISNDINAKVEGKYIVFTAM